MQKLIEGLHQFQAQLFCEKKELFEKLAQGQQPDALLEPSLHKEVSGELGSNYGPKNSFLSGSLWTDSEFLNHDCSTYKYSINGLEIHSQVAIFVGAAPPAASLQVGCNWRRQ